MKIKFTEKVWYEGLIKFGKKGNTATKNIAIKYPRSKWMDKYGSEEGYKRLFYKKTGKAGNNDSRKIVAEYKSKNLFVNGMKFDNNIIIQLHEDLVGAYPGRIGVYFTSELNAPLVEELSDKYGAYKIESVDIEDEIANIELIKLDKMLFLTDFLNNEPCELLINKITLYRKRRNYLDILNQEFSNEVVKKIFTRLLFEADNSIEDMIEKFQVKNINELEQIISNMMDWQWKKQNSDEEIENKVRLYRNLYKETSMEAEEILKEIKDIEETDYKKKIDNPTQKILVGAPGVGKSYAIGQTTKWVHEENKIRTVFHPDYENHDFVGSILPVVNEGNVTYEFKPGPFTKCLKEANKRKDEMHYLIIEEITRGNASAIFGEVFQLLDRKEDGESEYPITNEEMANVIYGKEAANRNFKIVIPQNVSILATANTSDQNVFVLDTAFKRRFEFEYLDVEVDEKAKLPDINVFGRKWKHIYMLINNYIVDVLKMSEDKQIGPFFIKNQSELGKLCRYLWEDIDNASFLSEETIFAPEYSNRFSKINKLCNQAIAGDTVAAEIMLSDNFVQYIKGKNGN